MDTFAQAGLHPAAFGFFLQIHCRAVRLPWEVARVDMDSLFTQANLAQLGGGTIAGIAVGYAAKKAARLGLLMLGLVVIGLYILAQQGLVTVHWDAVSQGIEQGSRGIGSYISQMIKHLSPSLVGFGVGFAIGLKL